jgi:hypothetical protein
VLNLGAGATELAEENHRLGETGTTNDESRLGRASNGAPRRPRRRSARFAVAVVVSAIATFAWAAPVTMHLETRVLGGPSDATSTIRDYASIERMGKTPFTAKTDPTIGAPEGIQLSPSIQITNAVQPAFIWALKGVVGLVAAWNLFILLGLVLTPACAWLLFDELGIGTLGSIFGACAFGLSGYLVDKAYAGHGGLVQAWIFPLIAIALVRTRRAGGALRWSLAAGFLVGVAAYLHTYYGFMSAVLVALFFLYALVIRRRSAGRADELRNLVVAAAAGILTVLPGLVASALVSTHGLNTSYHQRNALQAFGARIPAYFAPSPWSFLGRLVPTHTEHYLAVSAEPSLFFGFSTLILAAIVVWRRREVVERDHRFVVAFAIVLVVGAFIWSLPRLFGVGPVGIPMPSWFVGHFTTVIRVYARFGLLVGLGLAVLASVFVDRLARRRSLWGAALIVVVTLELLPSLPATAWATNRPSAADRWLANHPGGIAAVYPLENDIVATQHLAGREYFYQRYHKHPLYSAITTAMDPIPLAIRYVTQYFTNPDTPGILAAEHVRYVVLRDDVYREAKQTPPDLDPSAFKLIAQVPNARIFHVIAKPLNLASYIATHGEQLAAARGEQPPKDHFGDGFYGPEAYKYNTPWRWISQDAKVSITPDAGTKYLQFETLAFSNRTNRKLTLYGPDHRALGTAVVTTAMAPVTFGPFPVTRSGKLTFTLSADPGPTPLGPSDPRITSVYLNTPVFRPILVGPDR